MSTGELVYLDFGMMSEAPQSARYGIMEHIAHLVNRDYYAMANDYYKLGFLAPVSRNSGFCRWILEKGERVYRSTSGDYYGRSMKVSKVDFKSRKCRQGVCLRGALLFTPLLPVFRSMRRKRAAMHIQWDWSPI